MNAAAKRNREDRSAVVHAVMWGPTALCIVLFAALFALAGNTHEPSRYGPSVLSWLVYQWLDPGSESGYGWFVPLVSGFLVWRRRKALRLAARQVDYRGFAVVLISLFVYIAGVRTQQPRLGVLALTGVLWGGAMFLHGTVVARLLFFPCVYLLFMIPMSFLASATLPLRFLVCRASVVLLNGVGIEVWQRGTAIFSATPGVLALDVADPCSGLRSLIAMLVLTAAYGHVMVAGTWKKWLLFVSAVPLAVVGNITRVLVIAAAALIFGRDTAVKISHEYSGYIVFAVAVLLMVGLGTALGRKTAP